MPYIAKADLATHIPLVTIDKITSLDDNLVDEAISAAIAEAKSYLSRYKLDELFNDTTPTPDDKNLKNKVKDLACWHLVKLANPNISADLFKEAYDDAIAWLLNVAKGNLDPDEWNTADDDADTEWPEGGMIHYNSNDQRNNHF